MAALVQWTLLLVPLMQLVLGPDADTGLMHLLPLTLLVSSMPLALGAAIA